jgi:hypothetical protein
MRIGLLIEGGIDEDLLQPLVAQLASALPEHRRRGLDYYPVPFPPNGYGEIPKNLKMLVRLYEDANERRRVGCDLFVVILDSRRTDEVQRHIRDILREARAFPAVYGLAIQETEAWVLGDIGNVNRHVFRIHPEPHLPKAPEKDPDPKQTLLNLFIRVSPALEYDAWNRECARAVAPYLRKGPVARRCPRGFGTFAVKFEHAINRLD